MTTYYVRKTGSDAAAGTSAGAAWLTIGKALLAGGMASGDTVYVGAGVYRESITVGITPTATTWIIGDVDGSKTGDAGEVRWTAYTTDDKTAPAGFTCKLNAKNFLSFSNIHFVGGSGSANNGSCIDSASQTSGHDITFTKCAFTSGSALNAGAGESEIVTLHPADTAANWTFDSCLFGPSASFQRQVTLQVAKSTVSDYNLNILFKNCEFFGIASGGGVYISWSGGSGSFGGGGVTFTNCFSPAGACQTTNNGQSALSIPVLISNCVLNTHATAVVAGLNGSVVEDYNILWGTRSNTSIGPFTQVSGNYSQLFSYGQEAIWGGQPRQFGVPLSGSPMLGFGNAVLTVGRAPTVTDDATVGTIAWTTPANASVPDGTLTTAAAIPATTGLSHYLNAQSFSGFAGIPSDATIKSIRVEAIVSASAASSVSCGGVKLLKAGAIVGNDLASSNTTQFSTSATIQSWGNTTDPLWGTTWTPAQIQAAGFGAVWAAKNVNAATRDCSVDMMRVIVAYTTADGAGGVAVDMLGNPRPAGGGSTAYAVGALERGNTGTTQSATARTGSAVKLTGPAYHDFFANVDAAAVTIGIYARYDTAGQQPTVTLKAAPELGIAADVALTWSDPGANTWAQFSTTQTPTAAGIVVLRVQTAVGTGAAYFDDVSFS